MNDAETVQNSKSERTNQNIKRQNDQENDIHGYSKKIARLRRQLARFGQGDIAIRFLEKLKLSGLSNARICYYGDRLALILELFIERNGAIPLALVKKEHCESVLSDIISRSYSGETKKAYALALLRFIHFVKTGEIGDREDGYVKEVSWIKPSRYIVKNEESIKPEDLLTVDEVRAILGQTKNRRDKAMYWVLFEGAFRTGELLNLRVGGIDFRDDHVLVSTHGKTGSKRVALVLSFKPLLEWLAEHPQRNDPNAFLWHSASPRNTTKRISYGYLRKHLKQYARDANIKKRVWLYLMRHTQLTMLSKKLSDQTLRVYGNWSPNSNMAKKYVHLSGKDVDDAILELHGIKSNDSGSNTVVKLKTCPRCSEQNVPDNQRCTKCGYILDQMLLAKTPMIQQHTINEMRKQLERIQTIENKMDLIFNEILKQKTTEEIEVNSSS